ncbi:OmpA family protein [Marinobacter sp.]|uniref:OmpA family protein n=1 Tax=Marinobacter sp. TaxID=50741 RepID=UPI00384F3103
MRKLIAASILSSLTLAACTTLDPYTGEEETSKAATGAAIGAATGAAAGAIADDGEGALKGAAAGAAVGGGIGYYMDRQEEELRRRLEGTGVRVKREGDRIDLIMPGNVTFATNQSTIQPQFTDVLESVGLVLKEFDKTAIRIGGHTDSTGSSSYNQLLSEQRAQSVADFLLNQGIAPRRVQATGYGESQPIASNDTEAGRQQNRRVELKLVPQKQ